MNAKRITAVVNSCVIIMKLDIGAVVNQAIRYEVIIALAKMIILACTETVDVSMFVMWLKVDQFVRAKLVSW
jgi:hypothetical protein